eukprot:CAMPEP_0185281062 /NCGR_PEP_ID=MMETSP1359-20130426/66504_1 /TAXON_ID=552665 /ORGANISM="Bigelowiella longifila, Strain CCMP242" /LENGTH=258 /DNA_ID=CAMNT_0027876443 /DNA_START=33 /DNA_END=809 /DNA_ORIENTATION=+
MDDDYEAADDDSISIIDLEPFTHIIHLVLKFLHANEVCRVESASKKWCKIASSPLIWKYMCNRLFEGKKHVRIEDGKQFSKRTYVEALNDSQRKNITAEELMQYHWEFSYKRCLGSDFTAMEPFFNSQTPRLRRFNSNGRLESLRGYEPFDISDWKWCLQKEKMSSEGKYDNDDDDKFLTVFPPVSRTNGSGIPTCTSSAIARSFQVEGDRIVYCGHMKFPVLGVKRVDNWGWILESTAVVFCSFSLKEYVDLSKESL